MKLVAKENGDPKMVVGDGKVGDQKLGDEKCGD
jgi:hypothetical protein